MGILASYRILSRATAGTRARKYSIGLGMLYMNKRVTLTSRFLRFVNLASFKDLECADLNI